MRGAGAQRTHSLPIPPTGPPLATSRKLLKRKQTANLKMPLSAQREIRLGPAVLDHLKALQRACEGRVGTRWFN